MTIIYHTSSQPQEPQHPAMAASSSTANTPSVPFGPAMRKTHFSFGSHYTPLNHGSYGAYPVSVRRTHEAMRAALDEAPDPFIALEYHDRVLPHRRIAAEALGVTDVDELVFVPNATTGSDTVLKNFVWQDGDVVLCYELIYDALAMGLSWVQETRGVGVHVVRLAWPVSDDEVVAAMVSAAKEINAQPGKRVRLAIVDTVVSMPGIRVPFERLVPALQAEGALVLVDGAHGVGHVDIDLSVLKPDFFVTNLHKWFFVPRGCAAFYVAKQHQSLIRTTLPTSHKFRPKRELGEMTAGEREGEGRAFVGMFDFTATDDTTAWLCVETALDFRNNVCGGQKAIQDYSHKVAQESAVVAAEILGTDIMDCPGSCIRDCFFANVRLPLDLGTGPGQIDPAHKDKVSDWFKATGYRESGMYFQTCLYRGVWWWRVSGMIYVDVDDFRRGAKVLKDLCARARNGEHVKV
ncbi:putative aminotransferase family protein [Hypomontagnella monticulosa]|nr:putative aminotransferase family protein [Hypomontagnella monticulosa]